jgi:hypothetical protein
LEGGGGHISLLSKPNVIVLLAIESNVIMQLAIEALGRGLPRIFWSFIDDRTDVSSSTLKYSPTCLSTLAPWFFRGSISHWNSSIMNHLPLEPLMITSHFLNN